MTKDEIKAELRRSACEDVDPFCTLVMYAFNEMVTWRDFDKGESFFYMSTNDIRTFFLLVAEAL